MSAQSRLFIMALGIGLFASLAGCQSSGGGRGTPSMFGSAAGENSTTASESVVQATPREREGGGLLRTGAIMLGPGVCRNWWRWQGDGLWGF